MEKYYLANLSGLSEDRGVDFKRIKLIEINYTRRPPSFGVLYLTQTNSELLEPTDGQSLELATLELGDNNVAQFQVTKRVKLSPTSTFIDFDAVECVELEEKKQSTGGSSSQVAHCVALTQDGYLSVIKLIDESAKCLKVTGQRQLSFSLRIESSKFVQCQLVHHQSAASESYVHLLAQKSYSLCKISQDHSSLDQICSYSLVRDGASSLVRFTKMVAIESKAHAIILQLDDSSLRIVQHSTCLATIDALSGSHLILVGDKLSSEELTLLSLTSESRLVAHSLLLRGSSQETATRNRAGSIEPLQVEEPGRRADPDELLPKEPSFELEQCWSLDLNDVDSSIRSLSEQEEEEGEGKLSGSGGCLAALWSNVGSSQPPASGEQQPAKYLLVAYKFHLLIYSFAQRPTLPFSVTYDQSFLKLAPLPAGDTADSSASSGSGQQPEVECIDHRSRPRLVHHFRLIGAQPADALFNGLFLVSRVRLTLLRHFAPMGLVVAATSGGHLLALKCTSGQVNGGRADSLYQQQVATFLRGGTSLLATQIERAEEANRQLRDEIAKLESGQSEKASVGDDSNEMSLASRLKAKLRPSGNSIGGLYELELSVSSLVHVNQVVVIVSGVNSLIMQRAQAAVRWQKTENNAASGSQAARSSVQLLANLNSSLLTEPIERLLRSQDLTGEPISSWCILELDQRLSSHSRATHLTVSLPMFLADGQRGQLRVFYLLAKGREPPQTRASNPLARRLMSATVGDTDHWPMDSITMGAGRNSREARARFHLNCIQVKSLMSYQVIEDDSLEEEAAKWAAAATSCRVDGCFTRNQMLSWLNECLSLPDSSTMMKCDKLTFKSPLTRCFIELKNLDNRTIILSDDFMVLNLIKRHVLAQATDQRIKLEVEHLGPSVDNLRHMIMLQTANLDLAIKLQLANGARKNRGQNGKKIEHDQQSADQLEMLLESLVSEMNLCDQLPISIDWLELSMKRDLEQLKSTGNLSNDSPIDGKSSEDKNEDDEIEDELLVPSTLRDVVCGLITDALIDFDHLQGSGVPQESTALALRSKLNNLVENWDRNSGNELTFCDSVLSLWREVKKLQQVEQ